MTSDLKAAIERVRDDVPTQQDFTTVLALAEIGRLAVEARAINDFYVRVKRVDERNAAADAFLAARKGGE